MSGTVPPPPPPGPDGMPSSVPPATGVRRVTSAYHRPAPEAGAPSPTDPAPQAGQHVHAPVPPPPQDPGTQQIPPVPAAPGPAAGAPTYPPSGGQTPAGGTPPAYAQPAYAAPTQVAPAQPAYAAAPQQQAYAQPPHAAVPPPGAGAAPAAAAGVPPEEPRRRRRLSAGWIVFIVVDVVLIVMALAFAVQVLSSSPGDDTAGGTVPGASSTPTAPATPSEEEPAEGAQLAAFASPSGNITCTMFENAATCGIAELDQQPAPVEGCSGTTGYMVTVDGEGQVSLPCVATKDQPKAAGKGADVLAYGDSRTEGDFTCTSDETGMSCKHDPSGRGFSIARAGIRTS